MNQLPEKSSFTGFCLAFAKAAKANSSAQALNLLQSTTRGSVFKGA